MTVKMKIGKTDMEISGTEEQVERAIDKWMSRVEDPEKEKHLARYQEQCAIIRRVAVARQIDGAKEMPIAQLLQRLLGISEEV